MGRVKTQNPAGKISVRADAWKAFGVTLLVHLVLFIFLGLVLVDKMDFQSGRIVVTFTDGEIPAATAPSLPVRQKQFEPKGSNRPPVEIPDPLVSMEGLAIDFISDFPELEGIVFTDVTGEVFDREASSKEPAGISSANGETPAQGWTGIQIGKDSTSGLPRITGVIFGGPAHRQGALRITNEGDYIVSVNGVSVQHDALEDIRDRIVGPVESTVILGLCRYPGSMIEIVKIRRGAWAAAGLSRER